MKDRKKECLCPLRRMKPCNARCAWYESGICAMLNLSHEVYYAADALRVVANVMTGAPTQDGSGTATSPEAPPWNT